MQNLGAASSTASAKNEEFMVDSGDQDDWTPLLFTCIDGHDAVVVRLLAAGVNRATTGERGNTTLLGMPRRPLGGGGEAACSWDQHRLTHY